MNNAKQIIESQSGVVVLAGYGIRVAVNRGHLCVEDGVGANRRYARFSRAERNLRRLVVLGHAGTISFDALRWLSDIGAGFAQIDSDGRVIAAAGPMGLQEPKLRRAQALTGESGLGLVVAKELIRTKLQRQLALLEKLPPVCSAPDVLAHALELATSADTIDRLRLAEAQGATAYWAAWSQVEVRFVKREQTTVPEHWRRFERRSSPLTQSPRKAANPANALLNYLYAVTEAEARLAALAVGLDPGLGVMHTDLRSRNSMASDLMEPVRPLVDEWLLTLLSKTTFRKRDFFETRQGVCRVMPPTTHALAETAPRWAAAIAPVAEDVVRRLLASVAKASKPRRGRSAVTTPLTQSNRRAALAPARAEKANPTPHRAFGLALGCEVCGSDDVQRGRRRCEACLSDHYSEAIGRASSKLRQRRRAGDDPAHAGNAAAKRSKSAVANRKANLAWERENGSSADPEVFLRKIQPKLAALRLGDLTQATGLSEPYCSLIRQGKRVPHQRHWETLRRLVG